MDRSRWINFGRYHLDYREYTKEGSWVSNLKGSGKLAHREDALLRPTEIRREVSRISLGDGIFLDRLKRCRRGF
jgi:hypothetical protein